MECSIVRLAHVSPNICLNFKLKRAMCVHRQTFLLHIPGKDNPCPLQGRGSKGNFPPSAGGNILGGRNTEVGKELQDGYTAP